MEIKEYFSERAMAFQAAAEIFYDLGNMGMALVLMNASHTIASVVMPSHLDPNKSIAKAMDLSKLVSFMKLRHPDPQLVPKIEIKDESMQVYGSWIKVKLKTTGGIPQRMGFASFVYQGECCKASLILPSADLSSSALPRLLVCRRRTTRQRRSFPSRHLVPRSLQT